LIKVGRYTSALLIIAVGAAILIEQASGYGLVQKLVDWWPLLLISLGLEYMYFIQRSKGEDLPMKVDVAGIVIGIAVSAVIVGGSKVPQLIQTIKQSDLIESLPVALFEGETGTKVDQIPVNIPLGSNVKKIKLHNVYGSIILRGGDLGDVSVQTSVWRTDAAGAAGSESRFRQELDGDTLTIESHENASMKRTDLTVIVPSSRNFDFEVELVNGSIEAAGLHGKAKLETVNGSIAINEAKGDVWASTVKGSVRAQSVDGDLELSSQFGSIEVKDVTGRLKAESTASSITIESVAVGGDWDVSNTVGSVTLGLPSNGDFDLEGSAMGNLESEFPLARDGQEFNGRVGGGKHDLHIETIGSLVVKRAN